MTTGPKVSQVLRPVKQLFEVLQVLRPSHEIMNCEALGQLRARVFGKHLLTELDMFKVKDQLKFLNYPRVARIEEFPQ